MSRTKGSHNKHKKEKPIKEKKKRGRPSKQHQKQYQHQTVNVNVNSDGGGSSQKSKLPTQIPLNIFDPSLITPHYGINDRQPTNPMTDASTDVITPFLQAMISNQKQNQQQIITPQPKPQPPIQPQQPVVIPPQPQPQPQPIIITQPKQPEKPPTIILPKPKPEPPGVTHEDVKKYIDQMYNNQNEVPEPIPQNTSPKKPVVKDLYGFEINDKYDGIKMKNKTMPISEVAEAAVLGIGGGIASGLAGPSIVNNLIATGTAGLGYQLYGERGAVIGNIIGASLADKYNPSYASYTNKKKTRTDKKKSEYEEIPSYSNQRVNGGTVIETRNTQQREPSYNEPKQPKLLISRLGDALKDVSSSSNRVPPSQKIKESKLLKDLEKQQKSYGTIQQTDVTPQEEKVSTLTNIKEGVKKIYRRLSGQTKSQYSRIPTDDYDVGDDFSTTLKKSKKKGKTQGTYSILPDEEIDIEHELEQMNKQRQQYLINEQEIENMTRSAKKRQPKTQEVSLLDARIAPNDWPIMQTYKEANETNIRKSIARTDKAEREERIKQGLLTPPPKPPKTPRTPKQQIVLNNFGRLIGKSQDKKKENDFFSVLQEAEPLITKREVTRLYKKRMGQVEEYTSRLEGLERERAALQPVIERHEATRIQKVLRGHIGRNQFKKKERNGNKI